MSAPYICTLMRKGLLITSILVLFIFLGSCSKFRKIQKSTDWQLKHDAAMNYYENKDYYRSSILFEDIMPYIKGKPENEKVQFYFAYVQYYQKQYLLSAHYFKGFYDTYRRSDYAEEAYFMYAKSLYKQSPPYNLDQSSSAEAIEACQSFINKYPTSEWAEEALQIMTELRGKLEKKAYEIAKNYYSLGRYNSALVAFNNFDKDFPDSDYRPEIAYLKILAAYDYADRSIALKQTERYRECVNYYQEFIDEYPDSKFVKEAGDIYSSCLSELEKLAKNNS